MQLKKTVRILCIDVNILGFKHYFELVNHILALSFLPPSMPTMPSSKEHVEDIHRRMKSSHITSSTKSFLSSFIINLSFPLI